jgi:hypothetical protein
MIFASGALIVRARRRIGADDEKIRTCGEALVTGASGEDRDIAGFQLDSGSIVSAEADSAFAPRYHARRQDRSKLRLHDLSGRGRDKLPMNPNRP